MLLITFNKFALYLAIIVLVSLTNTLKVYATRKDCYHLVNRKWYKHGSIVGFEKCDDGNWVPIRSFVVGIACFGDYCDSISLYCADFSQE